MSGSYFKTGFKGIQREVKERAEESSVKYQIQVPNVLPSIDPDRENHNDLIKTMTNFYPSNQQSNEINKSEQVQKKMAETPTRSADSSKKFKLNVQNTIVSLDKFSQQSKLSDLEVKIPLAQNQKILPELNRKSSLQSSIENVTSIQNKKPEFNEYKHELAKSLRNMHNQKQNIKMDPQMPYIGQFYPEKSVKKINQFNSFKRYSQNNIYTQSKIDRNLSSLNVQNVKFHDDRISQNLSDILQFNNPIQKLKVKKSNKLNENSVDQSFANSKSNDYENLDFLKNKHKFTKSIDDNQYENAFQDSLKQEKQFHFNEKKGLLEMKNKNIYQKNMMLLNLRKKSDKYQLGIPIKDKKYETISQEVLLEGESLHSNHRLNKEHSRFKNEYLNYDSKLQLSTDELFNNKEIPKSILISDQQMLIQENKQEGKNDEMIANFLNFQIKPVISSSVEQSFFSVATNRQKTTDRKERSSIESPKNRLKFDGKFLDFEKKRIDNSLKNLDSVQIDIDRKIKELTQIDEKSLLEIPFSLLNALAGTLEGVVFAQDQGKQQIYSKQFSNLIHQIISDLRNSKKLFSACINQLNLKKDKNIQMKDNIIESLKKQIEQLQQRLIDEDKILNSERQKEVRNQINEYFQDQNIINAKLGGVFNKLNKVNDEVESKKKNRTYQDLQDLLQLAMYSGANKQMLEILQQQQTILEIEKKNGELVQIAEFDRNLLDEDNSIALQNELNKMMLNKAKNVQKDTSKILVKQLVKNIEQKDNFSQTLNNDQQVIKELEIMCGDYIKKYEILKQETSGFKKIIDQLTAKNNSMKNVERGLKDQIKDLNLKIEELKFDFIQEQEKYSNVLDQIEDQKKQQKLQFEQNLQKIQQLQERIQYQESIIKTFNEQKKAMEDQIQQIREELEEKKISFQDILNEKDEIIQKLNIEINEKDLLQSQVLMDYENLKTELKNQIDENNQIQKNIEELMKVKNKQTSESEEIENEQNESVISQKNEEIKKKKKKKKSLNKPVKNVDAKSSIPKSNEKENRIGTKIEVHKREMRNGKFVLVPQTKQQMKDFFVQGQKVQNTDDTLRQYQNDVQQQSFDKMFFSQSSQTDIDTMTFLKILNLVKKSYQTANRLNDNFQIQKQQSQFGKNKDGKIVQIDFCQQVNKQQIKKEIQIFEQELKNQAYFYAQNSSFTKHSVLDLKQIKDQQKFIDKDTTETGRQRILLLKNNNKINKGQQADTTEEKNDNIDSYSVEEEQHHIPLVNSYSQSKIYDQIFTPVDFDGSLYQNSRLEVIQEGKSPQNVRHIISLIHQNNKDIQILKSAYKNEKINLKDEDYTMQKLEYSLSESKSLASANKDLSLVANQINFNINLNNFQSYQNKNSNKTPESQKISKFSSNLSPSFSMKKQNYSSIQNSKNQPQVDHKSHKNLPISIKKFNSSVDKKQVFKQQNFKQFESQFLSLNPNPDGNFQQKQKLNKDFEELDIIYSEQQLTDHLMGLEEEKKIIDQLNSKLKVQKSSSVKSNYKQVRKVFQEKNSKLSFQYKWPPQKIKQAVGGGTLKSDNSLISIISK